jgi:hypothetical protein
MDNITLNHILSESQKVPETVDEFVVEILRKNISDSAILKSIKAISEEMANENIDGLDQTEMNNFVQALRIVLENRNNKKHTKNGTE